MKPSVYISSFQVFIMMIAIRKIHGTDSKDCAEGDLECNLQYIYDNYNANPNANSYNTYDAYDLAGGQNNQDYGNQPAGGDDHGFQQSYHYTIDEGAELEYTCYSCTFHVRQKNAAGLDNCRDPFVKLGIPEVPCKGACAKLYHKTSETEYTITRICLPNCKEVKDEKGYTQCCWGHLCNGSNNMNNMEGQSLTLILGVLLSSLLMALR